MKRLFLLLVATGMLSGRCTDDTIKKSCDSVTSIETIPWISEITDTLNCTCEISIFRGKYEGQTVFFASLTDAACNGISTPDLYDCDGNVVRSITTLESDQRELTELISHAEIIHRCKD